MKHLDEAMVYGSQSHNCILRECIEGASPPSFIVEIDGELTSINGHAEADCVGKIGQLLRHSIKGQATIVFKPYVDQTLRRRPALDFYSMQYGAELGWQCAAKPNGFTAPPKVVPGQDGAFIRIQQETVFAEMPEELIALAKAYRTEPDALLRAFAADLCAIANDPENPRSDALSNNGHTAIRLAADWMKTAFGSTLPVDERNAR